jgi:RimJ/RimL family protein N-acetyltransferase
MKVQGAQAWLTQHTNEEQLRGLENKYAATLMRDGRPVACAGALEFWENRALVWSWLSDDVTARDFRVVHGYAKRFLEGLPFRRLEAAVDVGFEAGHRWVKALGFRCEAPRMEAFEIDGRDSALYARVRK